MTCPTAEMLREEAHQARRVGRARREYCWLRLIPKEATWPAWLREPPAGDAREEREVEHG